MTFGRSRTVLPSQRDERQRRVLSSKAWALLGAVLFLGTLFTHYVLHANQPVGQAPPWQERAVDTQQAVKSRATLVIYVFRNSDALAVSNLGHFIESIPDGDPAHYIIALDPAVPLDEMPSLPTLPARTEVVRPPPCFPLGVVGWLLYSSGRVSLSDYESFVWVSSAVRGPFLPVYVRQPWHTLLTQRLRSDTKLVGATISCSKLVIDKAQLPLQKPHVQHEVMATDKTGLGLLKAAGALDCHANWMDNIRFGEFGASEAVLRGGYNLDCLMKRYQGVEWRDKAAWGCNARIDPHLQDTYDGISLNPLEVLFVRLDMASLALEIPAAFQAAVYSQWEAGRRGSRPFNLSGNSWIQTASKSYDEVMARPKGCFDHELYILASPVEFAGYSADQAYEHFRAAGFREGRPYGFLC